MYFTRFSNSFPNLPFPKSRNENGKDLQNFVEAVEKFSRAKAPALRAIVDRCEILESI